MTAQPSPRRPLVLLVDEDVRAARHLAKMLAEDGFDVELALDGAAAIARLGRRPIPDALVTDMYMPHADGIAVTRYARSRCPGMLAVVVTGHAELVAPNDLAPPAPVVLSKPLDYETLTHTLRTLHA